MNESCAHGRAGLRDDRRRFDGVARRDAPVGEGGLGFTFKWNMGWMHDTLSTSRRDPLYRRYHQDQLTFAMVYEYSEHFIMPLSHDEVVHLKGSLLEKMPGDHWQKLANLRALLAYQFTRPGKSLLFMGTELAPPDEWNHDRVARLAPARRSVARGAARLPRAARARLPASTRRSGGATTSRGLRVDRRRRPRSNSVLSYVRRRTTTTSWSCSTSRRCRARTTASARRRRATYVQLLRATTRRYGGSGYRHAASGWRRSRRRCTATSSRCALTLPPLGALVLAPVR